MGSVRILMMDGMQCVIQADASRLTISFSNLATQRGYKTLLFRFLLPYASCKQKNLLGGSVGSTANRVDRTNNRKDLMT
jgi:hypothetical protein